MENTEDPLWDFENVLSVDGDWMQLQRELDVKSWCSISKKNVCIREEDFEKEDKEISEKEYEDEVDKILRGPIWNYGKIRGDEKTYYSKLLFGGKKETVMTPDELILKGEIWIPSKYITESLSTYVLHQMQKADPESIALVEMETGRYLKYKEVIHQASSLACGLYWAGVLPGHVIAVVTFNSLEGYLMILASLLVGSITALVDPSLSSVEIGRLLRIANPRMVFCECGKTAVKVELALGYIVTPIRPKLIVNARNSEKLQEGHISFQKLLVEVDKDFKPAFSQYNPDNPVFIFFTSGISSTPKGALISERFFMNSGLFIESILSISTLPYNTLLTTAIFWVIGTFSLLSHLINRHQIVFPRGQVSEAVLIKVFQKFKVAVWITAPNTLLSLLNWPAKPRHHDIKVIWVTGMSIKQEALVKLRDKVFDGKVKICQMFGMTEIGIASANLPRENKFGSVGKLLRNVQMKVLEKGTGIILGSNQEGELCFRSNSTMLGYYYKTDDTENVFDREGFVHTGDLGYFDDFGFVYITGRLKDVIKWKCYQVIPHEVEVVLLDQLAVKEAVVVGLPHETDGELVTAAILFNPGFENTSLAILEKAVNDELSPSMKIRGGIYHMSNFPRNAAGKPNKGDIVKQLLQQQSNKHEYKINKC